MKALRQLGIFIIVMVFMLFSSLFTVQEGNGGLLLQFGKFVKDGQGNPVILQPGLHVKWPVFQTVKIFDTRLQTLVIESSRILTSEKKDVIVDYYVKWRINNLPLFYTRTGASEFNANALLQQQINDGLRVQFGRRMIKDVVSDDRSEVMATLLQQANANAKTLGIQVVDVRIKSIDLPPSVSDAVFQRMRAERERIATQNRSIGKAEAGVIRAKADAQVTITLATANAEAAKIRATGDAQAAKIYADAYNQDPQFFTFYRSINAFQASFDGKKDVLVISPRSEFFKYFENPNSKTVNDKP